MPMDSSTVKPRFVRTNTNVVEQPKLLLQACRLIRSAIQPTIGPHGTSVFVNTHRQVGNVSITRDGFTIYSSSDVAYPASLHHITSYLNEIVATMVHRVGDGTSTAILTTASLIKNLLPFVLDDRRETIHPQRASFVAEQLRKTYKLLADEKLGVAKYVQRGNSRDVLSVIETSCAGDVDIVANLERAWADVNYTRAPDILIDRDARVGEDRVRYQAGLSIDADPLSKYIYNMMKAGGEPVGEYADVLTYVVIREFGTDSDIEIFRGMVQAEYNSSRATRRPIAIVATSFSEKFRDYFHEVLERNRSAAHQNPETVIYNLIALRVPADTPERSQLLYDFAALAGCLPVSNDASYSVFGSRPDFKDPAVCGMLATMTVAADFTTCTAANPSNDVLKRRVEYLKTELASIEEDNFDARRVAENKLNARISSLTTGLVCIAPGGLTYGDQTHRVALYEDASLAARHALSGTLPGGLLTSARVVRENPEWYDKDVPPILVRVIAESLIAPYVAMVDQHLAYLDYTSNGYCILSGVYHYGSNNCESIWQELNDTGVFNNIARTSKDAAKIKCDVVNSQEQLYRGLYFDQLPFWSVLFDALYNITQPVNDVMRYNHSPSKYPSVCAVYESVFNYVYSKNTSSPFNSRLYNVLTKSFESHEETHVRVPVNSELEAVKVACTAAARLLCTHGVTSTQLNTEMNELLTEVI